MYLLTKTFWHLRQPILWIALLVWSCSVAAESRVIEDLDFQRNQQGQGVLVLNFAGSPVLPDVNTTETGLELSFPNTSVLESLRHLYDTNDFNTLVTSLRVSQSSQEAKIDLRIEQAFSHSLYQQDEELRLVVSSKPGSNQDRARGSLRHFQYTGEPMSLSYQNVPIRQLLKELADFLDLNLVAGESVRGEITLQLQDVPSDQALDLILKTQNLASRQVGNVLLVAPTNELVELEEQQFQAQRSEKAMEPLVDEFIQVHFARAEDLRRFILDDSDTTETRTTAIGAGLFNQELELPVNQASDARRFLSDRGHLMVDRRTNQIYVRDTAEQVERVRNIIRTLDVPVEQVMIEARIVVARTGVSDELGVTWGASRAGSGAVGGFSSERTRSISPGGSALSFEGASGGSNRGGSIDFNPQTGIGFGFVNNNFLLDLELAALETENRSEIISQPKVITSDRVQATIRSGEQIPYRKVEDGTVSVEFQNAELVLEVTPHITHDGRILMDLQINNDSKGEETNDGFTINSNSVSTQVLSNNGETLVIGGIFTSQSLEAHSKTPILGDLPLIGWLFSRSFQSQEKVELLVFITPRMLESSFSELRPASRSNTSENPARPASTNRSSALEDRGGRAEKSGLAQTSQSSQAAKPKNDTLTYILQQPEDRFVLQVYADTSRERAESLMQSQTQPKDFTLIPTQRNNQPWYIVIYGDYPDIPSADAAIQSLPRSLQRNQPWARSYRVMQRLITASLE